MTLASIINIKEKFRKVIYKDIIPILIYILPGKSTLED